MWQHVQARRVGAAVDGGDADEHVGDGGLAVFNEHVEVAVAVEDSGVDQFVFGIVAGAAAALVGELRIGEGGLRIFVERLHVRVGGRAVEVIVILFHVLAVVALVAGEAEQPLFENRVALVPQRNREAQQLRSVADAQQPVLAPTVGAAARVIVRQVIPRRAVRAVVLAHRSPLAVAEVRPPQFPVGVQGAVLGESLMFGGVSGHGFSFVGIVSIEYRRMPV